MFKLRSGVTGLVGAMLAAGASAAVGAYPPGRYPCPPIPKCAPGNVENCGIFVARVRPWPGTDWNGAPTQKQGNSDTPTPAVETPSLEDQIEAGKKVRDLGTGSLPEPGLVPNGGGFSAPTEAPNTLPGSNLPGNGLPSNGIPGGPLPGGDTGAGGLPTLPAPPGADHGIGGAPSATTPSAPSATPPAMPPAGGPGAAPVVPGLAPGVNDSVPALPLPNKQSSYQPAPQGRTLVPSTRQSYRWAEAESDAPPTIEMAHDDPVANPARGDDSVAQASTAAFVESKVTTADGESTIRWKSSPATAETVSYQQETRSEQPTQWVPTGDNPLRARLTTGSVEFASHAESAEASSDDQTSWQPARGNPLR